MSTEPNPYAPPPEPDPTRALTNLERPTESPLATHTITLPARPPVQGTLTFYRDRLFLERSDGAPTISWTHDDFLASKATFIVGGVFGSLLSSKTPIATALRMPPDAVRSFRRWIGPRLDEFRQREIRDRVRLAGILGGMLVALSVPPLARSMNWESAAVGGSLVVIAIAARFVRHRASFLIHAAAWIAYAGDNVLQVIRGASAGWLVASLACVLFAARSVRAFNFYAPAE